MLRNRKPAGQALTHRLVSDNLPFVATYEAVLDALGDPTRRAILETLRRGPRSVTDLTEYVAVSRPAISQHLKVLGAAGLVDHESQGTRNIYRVDQDGLESLREWLDQFWTDALDAFVDHVRRTSPGPQAGRIREGEQP